jgi:hypothetical protein
MILTNVCSVDITAFMLDINVTSPIPQEHRPGMDVPGALARHSDKTRAEFPFDWSIVGEPEDDPHPLEFTVRARGAVFRDGTAAGDATWVTETQEDRKRLIQQFATELKLLAQIARLEDAKRFSKATQTPL